MKNTLFLFLLALIATSCASIDYSTNYDQTTKVEIKKIVIVSEAVKKEGFVDFFSKELTLQAKRNKIEVLNIFKDSLSFTTSKDIAQSIAQFNPDVVIELKMIERSPATQNFIGNRNGFFAGYDGTYHLAVRRKGEDKTYWKSLINIGNEHNIYNSVAGERGYENEKPYINLVGKKATEILTKIIKDSNNSVN